MHIQTLALPPVVEASPSTPVLKPGIYRGKPAAEYGLWRVRRDGALLYCAPVAGAAWKRVADRDADDVLTALVDATLASPAAAAAASAGVMWPGVYRGQADAEFGLWRLRPDGVWLFCVPVLGAFWKRAGDQNPGDKLILLVDETRI